MSYIYLGTKLIFLSSCPRAKKTYINDVEYITKWKIGNNIMQEKMGVFVISYIISNWTSEKSFDSLVETDVFFKTLDEIFQIRLFPLLILILIVLIGLIRGKDS